MAALRAALADGTIDAVATDHAPHALEDKETEWAAARPGMLGLETALSVAVLAMRETGLLDWRGLADRMSAAPARIGGLDAAGPGGGRAGVAHAGRPGRPVDPGPGRVGLPQPQHAVRRAGAAGPGGGDLPARRADRAGREGGAVTRPERGAGTALLVLEDGRTFRGEAFGAVGESVGEAVFATGMTGYQETLTDPSYHRQVVVMTAPHVGNTGINDEDAESSRVQVAGYVVRDPTARALVLAVPPLAAGRAGAGRAWSGCPVWTPGR